MFRCAVTQADFHLVTGAAEKDYRAGLFFFFAQKNGWPITGPAKLF